MTGSLPRRVEGFEAALREAARRMPELAGLAAVATSRVNPAVPAVVVETGARIHVNPEFWSGLDVEARAFVVAHELLHLLLRTGARMAEGDRDRFNYAHDAHINDRLRARWQIPVQAGGVDVINARFSSAERIALRLSPDGDFPPSLWPSAASRVTEDLHRDRPGSRPSPPQAPSRRSPASRALAAERWKGSPNRDIDPQQIDVCVDVGTDTATLDRMKDLLSPHMCWGPYRAAVSTSEPAWFRQLPLVGGRTASTARTWARPSRRRNDPQWFQPGRARRKASVTVLLDVSTSMVRALGPSLAAMRSYMARHDLEALRVVQATSGGITGDDVVSDAQLDPFSVRGEFDHELHVFNERCPRCGGRHAAAGSDAPWTDLRATVNALLRENGAPVVVFTDGRVHVPERGPSDWTWVVFGSAQEITWGRVIAVELASREH